MLRSLKSILGYAIQAKDGQIGSVKDAFFDDESWVIRYLVIETGTWLSGRSVLLSPIAFTPPNTKPDWSTKTIEVSLTKEQVRVSPDVDADKPVSRQNEIKMSQHYKWSKYWEHDFFAVPRTKYTIPDIAVDDEGNDLHVRSAREILGYLVHGIDGNAGRAEDFIIDDETWHLVYFVVGIKKIFPGKKVLLALEWIKSISWERSRVDVDLSCDSVRNGPEFHPDEPVNREVEEVLYDFYGRPKYWSQR
ncbi:MAG: PRC-barrel domain-containing protein [Candidatus Omnitrophota bacterium]